MLAFFAFVILTNTVFSHSLHFFHRLLNSYKYLKKRYGSEEAKHLWGRTLEIYRRFVDEAPDIGGKENNMSGNLYMALAVFAFYEATGRSVSAEELNGLMADALPENIPVVGAILDMNKPRTQKMLRARFEKYKALSDKKLDSGEWGNSWRVEMNPHGRKTGVAFDLVGCPLADFAKSHGYDDILPLLCSFDHATASLMRARLIREHTISEGGAYCDYWYVGDQEDSRETVSVRYRIAEKAVSLTGIRKLFGLPREELFAAAAKFNRNRGYCLRCPSGTVRKPLIAG